MRCSEIMKEKKSENSSIIRYESQDHGINKRPWSNLGRFSVKILGAPTQESKRVIIFRFLQFYVISLKLLKNEPLLTNNLKLHKQ